jgi:hypothetical protein
MIGKGEREGRWVGVTCCSRSFLSASVQSEGLLAQSGFSIEGFISGTIVKRRNCLALFETPNFLLLSYTSLFAAANPLSSPACTAVALESGSMFQVLESGRCPRKCYTPWPDSQAHACKHTLK